MLLCTIMMFSLFSGVALATDGNGDYVLTSISHEDAIASVSLSNSTEATLNVDYGYGDTYGDTLDLSEGLDPGYSATTYDSVIASFPYGSDAEVGGDPVEMLVEYTYADDTTSTIYSTTYYISVVEDDYDAPTFSGTITKTLTTSETLTFTSTDFTGKYITNDGGSLAYISISGSNPSFGSLKYNGSTYSLGAQVSISNISSGLLTFAATAAGTVSYTVTAYASGDTSTPIGSAVLKITASANTTADTITYSTSQDDTLVFKTANFESAVSDVLDDDLDCVKFTLPDSDYGVLYYNYTSSSSYDSVVTASKKYYDSASPYLSKVAFVPDDDYDGTVSISYTAYNEDGDYVTGTVKITVTEGDEDDDADTITYTTDEDEEITFDDDDFDEVCNDATDEDLDYVKFTLPSSSKGVLYYNYTSSSSYGSKVSVSTKYYLSSSPYLSKVTFVPAEGYTGTVSISYTGYNDDGDSFSGIVKITVGDDADAADTITYTTDEDEEITFDDDDFDEVCNDATDENLDYVKFTLPSSSCGVLYYNYNASSSSKVTSSTKYYMASSSYLSKVTFVPADGYTGTVSISYTGYNEDGDSYSGTVKITVSATSTTTSSGTIKLTIGGTTAVVDGSVVTLDAAPFLYTYNSAGYTMVPIRFVSEQLGATVDWNNTTKTVTITLDGKILTMKLGVANSSAGLVVAPMGVNGRTYVPLRYVSEQLGATVDWNATTKAITITQD